MDGAPRAFFCGECWHVRPRMLSMRSALRASGRNIKHLVCHDLGTYAFHPTEAREGPRRRPSGSSNAAAWQSTTVECGAARGEVTVWQLRSVPAVGMWLRQMSASASATGGSTSQLGLTLNGGSCPEPRNTGVCLAARSRATHAAAGIRCSAASEHWTAHWLCV